MEVELISPSMDWRVKTEGRGQMFGFQKRGGERNLLLRCKLGGEGAPWLWKVEIRPQAVLSLKGLWDIQVGCPVGSLELRNKAWWSLEPLACGRWLTAWVWMSHGRPTAGRVGRETPTLERKGKENEKKCRKESQRKACPL